MSDFPFIFSSPMITGIVWGVSIALPLIYLDIKYLEPRRDAKARARIKRLVYAIWRDSNEYKLEQGYITQEEFDEFSRMTFSEWVSVTENNDDPA